MLMEGWLWQALGERVSDVLCTCALDKLDLAVSNHVPQKMNTHIDMTRALAVSRILAHHDARSVVFPDLRRPHLRACETFEEGAQV